MACSQAQRYLQRLDGPAPLQTAQSSWLPGARPRRKGGSQEEANVRRHGSAAAHATEVTIDHTQCLNQAKELSHCRSMIEGLFTREHIDGMRPQIQKTVDNLLEIMIKEGCKTPVDVVEKLALPVASYVSPLEIEIE